MKQLTHHETIPDEKRKQIWHIVRQKFGKMVAIKQGLYWTIPYWAALVAGEQELTFASGKKLTVAYYGEDEQRIDYPDIDGKQRFVFIPKWLTLNAVFKNVKGKKYAHPYEDRSHTPPQKVRFEITAEAAHDLAYPSIPQIPSSRSLFSEAVYG